MISATDHSSRSFDPVGAVELHYDAQLAIRLVDNLEQKFDFEAGIWSAESAVKILAYSCQTVEALSLLNLGQISERLVAPALLWLVNLEIAHTLPDDEQRSVRLFPSRFKTLAALGRFDRTALRSDFQTLCDCLDESRGWMNNVPTEMRPELVTMIWLDTLLLLEQNDINVSVWKISRDAAFVALRQAFEDWLHPANSRKRKKTTEKNRIGLTNVGDASYALDLLLRGEILSGDSAHAQDAARKFVHALEQRRPGDVRESDLIYCGIQLSNHFGDNLAARAAVREFIQELQEGYASRDYAKQPIPFHAQVLRLLASFHGDHLSDEIQKWHWDNRRRLETQRKEDEDSRQSRELQNLLQTTFQVQIGSTEHISGLRSRNEVVRVYFGFKTQATNEAGEHVSSHWDRALRLIVKRGSVESLKRAIEAYNKLPPELQPYFARHAASLPPPSNDPTESWYLLMEDLSQASPLSEVLQEVDQPHPNPEYQDRISLSVKAVSNAFQALHRINRRTTGTTNQMDRLYLMPITECLDSLCDVSNFPTLKPYVDEGFVANGRPYKRLIAYLNGLKSYEGKLLRPPVLSRIHGDAHSRNIMLSHDLHSAKFVDVESLSDNQDYLADYALLLEDVAFYRLLPCNDPKQRVILGEFQSATAGDQTEEKQNVIRYPTLPKSCEAALQFQRELVSQIGEFASSVNDEHWKRRLWLAVAKALIQLVERQTNSGRLRTLNPRDALNMVLTAYAEAIRLLDELLESLEVKHGQSLPEIPFSGQQGLPRGTQSRALVQEIMGLFKQLPNVTLRNPKDAPAWIHYHIGDSPEPFAEFRTSEKKGEIALILFGPRGQLSDPDHLISGRTEDKKGWIIRKPELSNSVAVEALTWNVYHLMSGKDQPVSRP